MKSITLFAWFALMPLVVHAETKSIETEINAIFPELRALKPMKSGEQYTLSAHGDNVTGIGDDFLRRRTAAEVEKSGLSCGCGDYAAVFINRIEPRGFDTLLVDSAQISLTSLEGHDSGHVVVAVRPKGHADASWWLVDSTARNILSRDWSPDSKTFTASGYVYWIGYCGPLDQYPVHNHEELKRFYTRVLAAVPTEFFNRTLYHFTFTIDASLDDGHGGYMNPRVTRLSARQDAILARNNIKPERDIAILLARGAEDASGTLNQIHDRWVARVGLKSACSLSFLTYFEQRVRKSEKQS